MQRKRILAYKLLSFFLICTLISCSAQQDKELAKLAQKGNYQELSRRTSALLQQSVRPTVLYYRALALYEQGLDEQAYFVLKLFLSTSDTQDTYLSKAHEMILTLALQRDDLSTVLSSARYLEEHGILHAEGAQAYYQALTLTEQDSEAFRIFEQYLKDTISPFDYAEMIVRSSHDWDTITAAVGLLTKDEQLSLLQNITSDTVRFDSVATLLSLATPLEQAFSGQERLGEVYRLLRDLYGLSDMRVQQRKYSTLSDNF